MGLQSRGTLLSTTPRLSSLAATKKVFAGKVKGVHYQAFKMPFTGS
jgi:hypothetical protein